MRILIIRPSQDGEDTARLLALRGHQPLLAPLLTVHFLQGPEVALENVQAILATSANGARALARRSARRDVALLAVGPQTAEEARKLGFQNVKSADGDARALAQAVRRWAAPDKGALLQVAGEGNGGKLMQLLAGFTVRREILYGVTGTEKMPAEAAEALRQGQVDATLFFSPRSAALFRDCVLRESLPVENVIGVCISPAAAAALAPLTFAQLRVAVQPNQAMLLKLLD